MSQVPPLFDRVLQKRVTELETRNAGLHRDCSLMFHIACQLVRALALQKRPRQPNGFWYRKQAQPWVIKVLNPSAKLIPPLDKSHATWVWQSIGRCKGENPLPVFPVDEDWSPKDMRLYKVVPFAQPFPLELLEAIVSSADTQAISRTARASLACFKLSMPVLLDRLHVPTATTVRQIFASRPLLSTSLRLDFAHSYRHIRSLVLCSSSLAGLTHTAAGFNVTRLPAGLPAISLNDLTILIDVQRADDDDPTFLDGVPNRSRELLAHLDPTRLDIRFHEEVDEAFRERTYIVPYNVASVISRWSRLRHVFVQGVDLLTLPDDEGTDDEDEDDFELEVETEGVSFLNTRSLFPVPPGDVTIVWDLSRYFAIPPLGYANLLDLLLHRDDVIRQPWVKAFTVVVRTDAVGKAFQKSIDESDEDVPSTLKWKVMDDHEDGQST